MIRVHEDGRCRVGVFSSYRFSNFSHNPFISFNTHSCCRIFCFVFSQEKTWLIVLSSLWMGQALYFSLGNSNSLASIDASAGYVGLEDYVLCIVGPLLFVATYCGPILWLVAAVLSIIREARDIKR